MTATDYIQTVLLYVCWIAVIVRVSALRSRNQRPLWFALLMLALGMTMLQKTTNNAIQHVTTNPYVENVISSLMAVGVTTTLLTFAVRASRSDSSAPLRGLRRISWAATVVTMTVVSVTVIATGIRARAHFFPVPGTLSVLDLYWVVYLVYIGAATAATLVLLGRMLSRVHSWLVRTPVLLLVVGSAAFLVFVGSRFVAVFTNSDAAVAFGTYVSSLDTIGVSLGCSIAAFVPFALGLTAWRSGNVLYPLWKAVCRAAPRIALYPPRSRVIDLLLPQNSHLRLHRRLVEIRDGLLIMRDWVTPADLDQIRELIADGRIPDSRVEAMTTACWLKVAIAARAAGLPSSDQPLDLVRRGGADGESELTWLREVADVWSNPLTDRWAAVVSTRRPQGEPA